MIEYVFGPKGSGKTVKMIDMADDEITTTEGCILFVNDREHYRPRINHQIRFINVDEYGIKGIEELYGFLCGLMASNYDITTIYLDNLLRIIDANGAADVKGLVEKLEETPAAKGVKFVLSISEEEDNVPEFMKQDNKK